MASLQALSQSGDSKVKEGGCKRSLARHSNDVMLAFGLAT